MRLYQVHDRIFVSGHPKAADIPKLNEAGVTLVVCMSKKKTPVEVAPGDGLRERVLWYNPVPDSQVAVPALDFAAAAYNIVAYIKRDWPSDGAVLVHCLQGRNRSMVTALLARRLLTGESGETLFALAKELRPNCLWNELYASWVRSWKETLPC